MSTLTFTQLAAQADSVLQAEHERVSAKEARLEKRASELAALEATLAQREAEVVKSEKALQVHEEEVSRKLAVVRRDEEAQRDLQSASAKLDTAQKLEKAASTHKDEVKLMLEDLTRREIALSQREKEYKEEIELEIMRNMAFRK